MILLRCAQPKDVTTLARFAAIPGFFNLPEDPTQLEKFIDISRRSFAGEIENRGDAKYLFVAEDTDSHQTLGTSMIFAKHGTETEPHFYFQVGKEERFSTSINTGFIHGTLELHADTDGPTEIAGLVLDPELRNTGARIGRQISFVRFLYMGLHPDRFEEKVLAELLPPLDEQGNSPLWEAIGRRFTNMNYNEADLLCRQNKEFIYSLFPEGKIYTTFLSPEARDAIGKVNEVTEPVVHMLKKIGFDTPGQVDPFDGGPHIWGELAELKPVKNIRSLKFGSEGVSTSKNLVQGLLTKSSDQGADFRALMVRAEIEADRLNCEDSGVKDLLELESEDSIQFMPFY